jgi:hypothetical protein
MGDFGTIPNEEQLKVAINVSATEENDMRLCCDSDFLAWLRVNNGLSCRLSSL